jgi:ZIP family zinc transporter
MSVWYAIFWGAASSAALFLGQALAPALQTRIRATGLLMGFGAGTMISAIAYELIPQTVIEEDGQATGIAIGFLLGAAVYFVGDHLVDASGGDDRIDLDGSPPSGSGSAMFIGALLDGLPSAFILGIGIALGGSVSVAFLAAVFVSNIPQGAAGTLSLRQAGTPGRTITMMWGALTLASAVVAAAGFLLADSVPDQGLYSQAFAAGAVLVMLADSMMPEAFEHGGKIVGLLTALGFLVAAILTVLG